MDNYLTTPSPSLNELLMSETLLHDLNFTEFLNQLPAENSNNVNQPRNPNSFQLSPSSLSLTFPQNESSPQFQKIESSQQQNKVSEFSSEIQRSRKRSRSSNSTKSSTEKRRKYPLSQPSPPSVKEERFPSSPFEYLLEDDEDNEEFASLPPNERKKRFKEDK
jgi:hypothetical protein